METIFLIAQQLSDEGKIPNTALIKARLPKNTPLPLIIQGLKMWKADPNKKISTTDIAPATKNNNELERLIALKIQQTIAPLIVEIAGLKKQIACLQQLATEDKK